MICAHHLFPLLHRTTMLAETPTPEPVVAFTDAQLLEELQDAVSERPVSLTFEDNTFTVSISPLGCSPLFYSDSTLRGALVKALGAAPTSQGQEPVDDETIINMLLLVDGYIPEDFGDDGKFRASVEELRSKIADWTQETRDAVSEYLTSIHFTASDNDCEPVCEPVPLATLRSDELMQPFKDETSGLLIVPSSWYVLSDDGRICSPDPFPSREHAAKWAWTNHGENPAFPTLADDCLSFDGVESVNAFHGVDLKKFDSALRAVSS